eukprot:6781450-Prymnesium_polylepis.1
MRCDARKGTARAAHCGAADVQKRAATAKQGCERAHSGCHGHTAAAKARSEQTPPAWHPHPSGRFDFGAPPKGPKLGRLPNVAARRRVRDAAGSYRRAQPSLSAED